MKSNMFQVLEKYIFRFFWVILFILFSLILLEQGLKRQREEFAKLSEYMNKLKVAKDVALKEQEELRIRINSESDPAWVELILMKSLGVLPEGQQKVFFKKSE